MTALCQDPIRWQSLLKPHQLQHTQEWLLAIDAGSGCQLAHLPSGELPGLPFGNSKSPVTVPSAGPSSPSCHSHLSHHPLLHLLHQGYLDQPFHCMPLLPHRTGGVAFLSLLYLSAELSVPKRDKSWRTWMHKESGRHVLGHVCTHVHSASAWVCCDF